MNEHLRTAVFHFLSKISWLLEVDTNIISRFIKIKKTLKAMLGFPSICSVYTDSVYTNFFVPQQNNSLEPQSAGALMLIKLTKIFIKSRRFLTIVKR